LRKPSTPGPNTVGVFAAYTTAAAINAMQPRIFRVFIHLLVRKK
jgi:hypothetical protein